MSFVPHTKLTVLGIDKQEQRFNNLKGNLEAWKIYEIVNFCLVDIEDNAKSRVPVISGRTRDSISHMSISENFPVIAGECFVGAPWGAALEFGHISRGGSHVAGKNFFTPAAIKGRALFNKMMQDYIKQVCIATGPITPQSARKGTSKGHKFQYKEVTSTGQTRYHYGPKGSTRTSFKFVGQPSMYKRPSTRGRRLRNIYR